MDRLDAAIDAQAAAFYDDVETWRDGANRSLSDRIWRNRRQLEQRIDMMIQDAIRDGRSIDDVANDLIRYVSPSYSRSDQGKARSAAVRLASNETRRAHALATRDTSLTDPAGGYLRYTLSRLRHIEPHDCDTFAAHDEGFGRGVWKAAETPLPPRHPGCRCQVARIQPAIEDIDAFVDQLRVEYGLDTEPTDLSPGDLAIYRAETAKVRQGVEFLFRAWFEQTGLVTPGQLIQTSPSVRQWVADVAAEKARGR